MSRYIDAENIDKIGIWQISIDGFRCSVCGYKLQTSGFSSICPNCHSNMVLHPKKSFYEKEREDGKIH